MRGLLLLLCLCIYAVDGFEDIESKKIEEFNNIELVRVNEQVYLSYPILRPSMSISDFAFANELAYEELSKYNFGENYEHILVDQTTPMLVSFDIFDLASPRMTSFVIPSDFKERPPAPYYPVHLQPIKETYYFVRKIDVSDFRDIMHAAADLLVDLSYSKMPFDGTTVTLALYEYPREFGAESTRQNEIWVKRTMVDITV